MPHIERHRTHRIGWLRAAVLGANDGIVSTASLVLGVAAAGASSKSIVIAGVAGLVAGVMSMAAGEYVSVCSQADTERADLDQNGVGSPTQEHGEMTAIYVGRGLDAGLASNVATQLMEHDALGAHGRDELGLSETSTAKPIQAAMASAVTFSIGAALPLVIVLLVPGPTLIWSVSSSSLVFLALLGSLAARLRRRFCGDGCCTGDLLGRLGHGFDRWGWGPVWGHGLRSLPLLIYEMRHNETMSRR